MVSSQDNPLILCCFLFQVLQCCRAAAGSQDQDAAGPTWRPGPSQAYGSSEAAPADLLDQFMPSMHNPAYVVRPASHRPASQPPGQPPKDPPPGSQEVAPRRQSRKAASSGGRAAEAQQQQEVPEPKPRSPFRAFRRREPAMQTTNDWEGPGMDPQSCMDLDGDAGAGPRSNLEPNDEDIGRLMEMGYTLETATRVGACPICRLQRLTRHA